MNNFSQFGIEVKIQAFTGDKIKVSRILNREIVVHDFKIEKSNFKGDCLHLQIKVDETWNVIFTGSTGLLEAIQQVPKEGFPFRAIIVEDNERYLFTGCVD